MNTQIIYCWGMGWFISYGNLVNPLHTQLAAALSICTASLLLTPWSRVLLEKLIGFAANQEIPHILRNPQVHYRTHKRPPPVPNLSQLHPVPTNPSTSWRSILILSSHLRLGLPNGLFPSGFPTRTLCTPLPSSVHATCPAHKMR